MFFGEYIQNLGPPDKVLTDPRFEWIFNKVRIAVERTSMDVEVLKHMTLWLYQMRTFITSKNMMGRSVREKSLNILVMLKNN